MMRVKPAVTAAWLAASLPGLYLLFTSTSTPLPGIWPYDAKRLLQFALLLALFLLAAISGPARQALGGMLAAVPRRVGMTLAALFAWGVASAALNARTPMHLANSLSEVVLLALLVFAVFVIAAFRQVGGRGFDRIAISLLALTGLVVGVQELLGVAAAQASGLEFNFRISLLHFSWPRFYNQVQTWIVPVVTALPLLFGRSSLARVLCILVLTLHWYVILASGARGSFVSIGSAVALAALCLPTIRWVLVKWQFLGLALGALLFGAVALSFDTGRAADPASLGGSRADTDRTEQGVDTGFYGNESNGTNSFRAQSVGRPLLDPMGRFRMWSVALHDAGQHPVFGIGPMNYVCSREAGIGHPHNFPLQLAAEWGIPAALAACLLSIALLSGAAMRLRKNDFQDREDAQLAAMLLTGISAAALHTCLSGVLVMPASQVTGMLIVGWLVGLMCVQETDGRREPAAARAGWLLLPALALSLGLASLGVHEVRNMERRAGLLTPAESLFPRIWQDAKVCRLYLRQNNGRN